jgi:hypothetical protein
VDPNSVVAVLVLACALLVAGLAAGSALLVTRLLHGASVARHRLIEQTTSLRRQGPASRARMEQAANRVDRIRDEWAATDRTVADMTVTLATMRGSLEGLTRGRLAMLIRGAGFVSKAAQVALLWR